MCLNYIHLNKIDDAFVEIRRFDNKMKFVGVKYQALIDEAKIQLKNDYNYYDSNQIDNKIKFHNSAFARYLSMLLYRTENDLNSAEIDYNKIIEAFDFQKSIYNFHIPVPTFLFLYHILFLNTTEVHEHYKRFFPVHRIFQNKLFSLLYLKL